MPCGCLLRCYRLMALRLRIWNCIGFVPRRSAWRCIEIVPRLCARVQTRKCSPALRFRTNGFQRRRLHLAVCHPWHPANAAHDQRLTTDPAYFAFSSTELRFLANYLLKKPQGRLIVKNIHFVLCEPLERENACRSSIDQRTATTQGYFSLHACDTHYRALRLMR